MQVPSLGLKEPLEDNVTTHSGILVWKIPWTEDPGGLQSSYYCIMKHPEPTA